MRKTPAFAAAVLGLAMPLSSAAAQSDLDGSRPLICALNQAQECSPIDGCQQLSLAELNAPPFFRIDVPGRTIVPIRANASLEDQRVSEIRAAGDVDGKLILQGFEDGVKQERDGLGWTVTIDQDDGHMVVSAAGAGVAFVVFGACATLGGEKP